MSVILFPGQGAQIVGMGKAVAHLPVVLRMFQIANDVFKRDLFKLCQEGPQNELDRTVNSQAAVFVTSLAALEHLKETNPLAIEKCYATAGFSIGEYASLVLAGSISYEDALHVIKVRGESMQKASDIMSGGMATIFGGRKMELEKAMMVSKKWCVDRLQMKEPIVCQISSYLWAECRVIGGNKEALDFIEANLKEFHIKRMKRLSVSGAFHTPLMEHAQKSVAKALKEIEVKKPSITCYSNVNHSAHGDPKHIRRLMEQQICEPVRWEQILSKILLDRNCPKEEKVEKPEEETNEAGTNEKTTKSEKTLKKEKPDRVFPEIYECGPASHSGPVIRAINNRAYNFYKHIPA